LTGGSAGTDAASISGTLTNPTNTVQTATYTVTPKSGSCTGTAFSMTVTVNPMPSIGAKVSTICSGSTFSVSPTNGTDIVPPGTTYSWALPVASGLSGLAAGTDASSISGTLINSTNAPINVVYTVTPKSGNCTGTSFSVTITVNPTAQVNDPSDQVVCNGSGTAAVTFGTTNSGGTTTYSWTNNLTSIGLVAGGTGNIAAFNAVNTGSSPVTATIVVTPHFSNGSVTCDGPTQTFTITVNPTAQVNDPSDQVVCNGSGTAAVTFGTTNSGGTTTYSWTNNLTSIGLVAGGTGNIAAFNAVNTGSSPVTATIVVTPHFSNGSVTCDGPTQTFTITVNPTPAFTSCPSNISQSTDLNLCTAVVNYIATAIGPPTPTITHTFTGATTGSGSGTGSGSVFNKGITNVVITATNICAEVTCSFTVTITDNQKPNIVTCAKTLNIEGCTTAAITGPAYSTTTASSSEAEFENATNQGLADDNCGITSVTYIDVAIGTCPIAVTRTWTLADAAGNTTTCTQTINVKDTTAPIGIAPTGITEINACYVDATTPPVGTPMFNAVTVAGGYSDNCGGTVSVTLTNTSVIGNSCSWTVTYTFKVADLCGNELTNQTIKHSGRDNTAPSFTVPASAIVYKDASCNYAVLPAQTGSPTAVLDNCDTTPAVTYTDSSPVTGLCADELVITRTWKVEDNCGNVTTKTQTITVKDNTAPTISGSIPVATVQGCSISDAPPAATSVSELEDLGLNISDNCTSDANLKVASSFSFNGACPIIIRRVYTITDACNNSSTATETQIIEVNDKLVPVITGVPGPITYSCASLVPVAQIGTVSVTDNCIGEVSVTVTDVTTPGSCTNKFTIARTWTAVDVCGNVSSATQIITVNDQTPPTITNVPGPVTYSCASEVPAGQTASVTVSDNCSGLVSVTVTDVTTTGSCANKYIITRRWSATDICGNTSSATQTITVNDQTPPTISGIPGPATYSCAESVPVGQTASVTVSDNCSGSVTVSVTDVTTAGNCANKYIITRRWTATDVCGNISSATQTITVDDQTPPTISGVPASQTYSCAESVPAGQTASITVSDNCSGLVTVTVTDVTTAGNCANKYIITRRWTATDICGNTNSATQTITVDDLTPPTISGVPASQTYSCAESVPVGQTASVTVSDNCTGLVTVSVTDVTTAGSCANKYTIIRRWTATDICGNTSSATQIITVDDLTPPTISGVPASQSYSCASEVPAGRTASVTVTDNCTGLVTVTVTDVTTNGNCANKYMITRKWTATDICGNTSSATQIITVNDQTPPTISGVPGSVTYSCAGDVPTAQTNSVIASDNCSGLVNLTVNDVTTAGNCANNYTITRIWTATDICGNTSNATQIITVNDQTPPTILGSIPITPIEACSVAAVPTAVTSVAALELLGLNISDGCSPDGSLTVSSSDVSSGSCPLVVSRTYRVTDACGNFNTYTQIFNIGDTTAPMISGTISPTTLEGCSITAAPAPVTTVAALEVLGLNISDACTLDGALSVTSTQTSTGTCPIVITRTYRISDLCGNISTAVQTINIDDNTAPLIAGTISTTTIEGCAVGDAPPAVNTVAALESLGLAISDACTADAGLVVTSTQTTSGTCPIVITRIYRIIDACGNFSTATQSIQVSDKTAPAITGTLNTVTVEGCAVVNAPTPVTTVAALENLGLTINDACTTDTNLTVTSTQASTGSCPIVITRIYKITDACGNFRTATQTINVGDTTAPVAKCKDVTLSLKPDGTVTFSAAEIDGGSTDNCGIKSLAASKTSFTCSEIGAHAVTLTVTDNCGNISTCQAVVTIVDPNKPSLSINDVEVAESAGKAAITVTLANSRSCDVSFSVNTANNSAVVPGDYSAVSSAVYTIPGGSTSVVINVPITDDQIAEPTETFFVRLSNPVNAVIADDQGTVTILDDDNPPKVIIGDASVNEGGNLSFPVTLSNVSSSNITVTIGFTNITTSNSDYTITPVTVTFPAGTTSTTAVVPSLPDFIEEINETFIAKVISTTGSVGDTSDTGTGTILDDDEFPIAVDDNLTTDEDVVLQGNAALNDIPNGTNNVWSLVSQPAHGKVVMNANGTFTYTPNPNYNGSDSFVYKLCDQEGDCDNATVFITMKPVDDFPIANDDNFTAHMDGVLDEFVVDNDSLSGDGGNVWSIVSQPTNGTVIFNSDGSFTYTPNVGYIGNDSFTYKLCDVDGDCDEGVVNILVEDIIPNQVFTPNGDNYNDTYYVKGIEYYPGSRITIFNRWGNKVYQKNGYLNDWDGYSNLDKIGSKPLPVGTYYYLIDYGINRHKTGWVYLER
jgi:gliding motility-associated-like protein